MRLELRRVRAAAAKAGARVPEAGERGDAAEAEDGAEGAEEAARTVGFFSSMTEPQRGDGRIATAARA